MIPWRTADGLSDRFGDQIKSRIGGDEDIRRMQVGGELIVEHRALTDLL
jgi:hypothetical protein